MRLPLKALLIFAAVLFSVTAQAKLEAQANSDILAKSDIQDQIDAIVSDYADHEVFSGAVLVAKAGEVIYKKGHGLANREWQMANSPKVKFKIASMTKSFTATLTFLLIEQNKLSLDDTIDKYLPFLTSKEAKDKANAITIGHILSHRTGLPRAFVIPGWFKGKFKGATEQEFAEVIGGLDLLFTPGSDERYTNLGYFLLGLIIEQITGQSFEQVLQQQILTPLNLTDTGIASHNTILKNRASGYRIGHNGGYKNPAYMNVKMFGAGAAMYTTVEDLFKWDRALYGDFLSDKIKASLFGKGMHYGWYVEKFAPVQDHKPVNVVGSSGETPGFSSFMMRFVDQQHTVIILSNNAINQSEKNRMFADIAAVLYQSPETKRLQKDESLPISFLLTQGLVKGDVNKAITTYQQHPKRYVLEEAGIKSVAQQQMWSGNSAAAITLFAFNAKHFATSVDAHRQLADIYLKNEHPKLALTSYQKALALQPGNAGLEQKILDLQ
ncbi:MAG: serine hydrolase [Algicola sp.]|nr:serine hydrolase [Algicola sp.]